jgi:hypothetical protein
MSANYSKVLPTVLWHCTSEKGNKYLSGFLGKARVIGFQGESAFEGIRTWNIYLQPSREQEESESARKQQPRQPQPAPALAAPRPTGGQRAQRLEPKLDPGFPFHEDDISDIGRDR